jgi:osmoprotectant transport system ATP-binding protein
MNVTENVGVTPRLLGWDEQRVRERVTSLLQRVELDPQEYAERMPGELSGGQQQRVGIARALAAEPELLLLDEPFGALDPITRDRLQRWFRALRRELGITVVFVTHDMVEALLVGDRIAVMREGRLVQVGTPRELLDAPADDYVSELLETPRRQSRMLADVLEERA